MSGKLVNEVYEKQYQDSVNNNEHYWANKATLLNWTKPFSKIKDVSFLQQDVHVRWFEDGELNVCVNCVDRHLAARANQTAIIFEGNSPHVSRCISYHELHEQVSRFANALEAIDIAAGDRVILYMPMIPEVVFAMLACARIGAIHSVVCDGFSANALVERIIDCKAKLIITADQAQRGEKVIALKATVDEALTFAETICVEQVIVVKNTGSRIDWNPRRDLWYTDLIKAANRVHHSKSFSAEHPLFILYTSGSTGKPKGLQHSSAGYLLYAVCTFRDVFDYRDNDIYWCTADIGWITGHSYIVYGPLASGATILMYEGEPNYPNHSRFGEIIDKHNVTLFYTAPATVRLLMTDSNTVLSSSSRSSLRVLGTVGEPINPDVWHWYQTHFGLGNSPVIDTWWQTETGGHMITPMAGVISSKPGSVALPYFGIQPAIVDEQSDLLDGEANGHLVILDSWPGQARTIWNDHQCYIETYFKTHEGMYFTGDSARRDGDGYYWITGRVDDVLNVSGHRLGTAEIENVLVSHPAIAEAAVVGFPHEIKGEAIYVFVSPITGFIPCAETAVELSKHIRSVLGSVAVPDLIQWTNALPKTRSGKIMRRILRKIVQKDFENMDDISTLAEPDILVNLIHGRLAMGDC